MPPTEDNLMPRPTEDKVFRSKRYRPRFPYIGSTPTF